jgi:gamma-glutamylcyclotransferase (GGCT)/AIG2-like uncharacterized protein YtfP
VRVFVYGTLLDQGCVERVTGRGFSSRAGTLHGWIRTTGDHGYPVIHPVAGGRVKGLVLDGIDDQALRSLDAYEDEGRLYVRKTVYVRIDGCSTACDTYVAAATRVP